MHRSFSVRVYSGVVASSIAVWLLALAPVAVAPGLLNRWGWPVLALTLLGAAAAAAGEKYGELPTWFLAALAATAVLYTVAALSGSSPTAQFMGRAPRYEGFITLFVVVTAVWSAARTLGPDSPLNVRRAFLDGLSVAGVLLGTVSFLEEIGLRPFDSDVDRPGALAGNATDQGLLGVMIAVLLGSVLLYDLRSKSRLSVLHLAGLVMALIAAAASASRAAFLALAVAAGILFLLYLRSSITKRRDLLILTLGALGLSAGVVALPGTRSRFFSGNLLASQTIEDRIIIWKATLQMLLDNAMFGVGPGGFADSITIYLPDDWFTRTELGAVLDSPHNLFLQIAAATGPLGVLLFIGCSGAVLYMGGRQILVGTDLRSGLLAGAIAALVSLIVGLLTHVTSPKTLILAAVCVGIVIAVPGKQEDKRLEGKGSLGGLVPAIFFTLCFLLWVFWSSGDAFLLRGYKASAVGDPQMAQASFQTAARIRPWDADIDLQAAEALGGLAESGIPGAEEWAQVWAEQAVGRLPSSYRAHQALGMTALNRGDIGLAAQELKAAASLLPVDPRLQHELGLALAVSGDLEGARTHLERALLLAPDSAISKDLLVEVCALQEDLHCVERLSAQN